MILLFTSKNAASVNIAKMLVERHGFDKSGEGEWMRGGVRLVDTLAPTVLDVPTHFDTDCIIVLSSHKSRTPGKMLTAHVPGNWGDAGMGGESRTLNIAHAPMLKRLIRGLDSANRRHGLGWPVSLEADHHGPTCGVPVLFVEIGNGEEQWADGKAAEVVAEAVADAVFGKDEAEPVVSLGFGGGHYPRTFTRMEIEGVYAFGHIAPKYAVDGVDEEMFSQALERNVGKAAKVFILKDEISAPQRERIRALSEKAGVPWELV